MGYNKGVACALAVCACAVALAAASPVLLPEEEEVLAREAAYERTEDPEEVLPPIIIVPHVAINLHEVPNNITEKTLIAVNVLANIGALDSDTDVDEEIGEDGSTSKPPPHVILEALSGGNILNVTERIGVRSVEDTEEEGDDREEEEKDEDDDSDDVSDHSPDTDESDEFDKRK